MKAKKDDWVRIHSILMQGGQRAPQVPEDTAEVPYESWNKGFLVDDEAEPGSEVTIETSTGRRVSGTLVEINPAYKHSFGSCIPEIFHIDRKLKSIMKEIWR